ncbi:MAG: hydroxyacylglutathione hydrolase [Pseudomonadota bacterium]
MADVFIFPCLESNYGYLVHDPATGATASIDAPDGDAVLAAVKETGWTLSHILVTHRHADHVQGIEQVKAATGCKVVGPEKHADQIPGIDEMMVEGDEVALGDLRFQVLATPGHTVEHLTLFEPTAKIAFVGDVYFVMGCGRLFEGPAEELMTSMRKVAGLPDETRLYCGHEYAVSNARFAITVDPDNEALVERLREVEQMRDRGEMVMPTTVGIEKATNPYLRVDQPAVRAVLGMDGASDADVFGEIRRRKDNF